MHVQCACSAHACAWCIDHEKRPCAVEESSDCPECYIGEDITTVRGLVTHQAVVNEALAVCALIASCVVVAITRGASLRLICKISEVDTKRFDQTIASYVSDAHLGGTRVLGKMVLDWRGSETYPMLDVRQMHVSAD